MIVEKVLYAGIDCDCPYRFDGYLLPTNMGSLFDRYSNFELSINHNFVCVYFGTKTKRNLLYEYVLITKLKFLKAHFPSAEKLYNIFQLQSLFKYMDNFNSHDNFTVFYVLVYLLDLALHNTICVKETKHKHVQDFFTKMKVIQIVRFDDFIGKFMLK